MRWLWASGPFAIISHGLRDVLFPHSLPALLVPVCFFYGNSYIPSSTGATVRSLLSVIRAVRLVLRFVFNLVENLTLALWWVPSFAPFRDGRLSVATRARTLPLRSESIWDQIKGARTQSKEVKKKKPNKKRALSSMGSSKGTAGRSREKEISCCTESCDQKSVGRLWIIVWKWVFMGKVYGFASENMEQMHIFI